MMLKAFSLANSMAFFAMTLVLASQGPDGQDSMPILESYEETVTIVPSDASIDVNESAESSSNVDGSAYMRDLRNAMRGMGSMDPDNVYTVQAMLPAGEVLVLATASGCSLLNDPDDNVTGALRPLEFSFRIADLEDCGKVTEDIISSLQSEIAAEWANLGGSAVEGNVSSSTRLQEIGERKASRTSERDRSVESDFRVGVQDLASAFLAANLDIKLIPTTADGVFVIHFDINGNISAEEITQAMANIDAEKLREVGDAINQANEKIMNASPEELAKMEEEFKTFLEKNDEILRKEIEDGKSILEQLSRSDVSSKECSSLPLDQCASVSKCGVVKLNGKEKCMVSPKTVFWLMETNCGLQSKAGLLSIVRDFVNAGIMTEENHQTLRQSFDLPQICNAIVHTYLSADIAETEQHEAKRGFEM